MLQATDVWFGYDERARTSAASVSACRPAASSASWDRTGPARRRCCGCWRARGSRSAASVTLDGAPLTRFSRAALARRMAVVPQETQLAFDYTVAEVAMMGRYPHLGAFEIEGPGGSRGDRGDADVDRDAAPEGSPVRHAQRRREAARGDRGGAGADLPPKGGTTSARLQDRRKLRQANSSNGPMPSGGRDRLSAPRRAHGVARSRLPARSRGAPEAAPRASARVAIVISTHDLGLAGTLCDTSPADPRRRGRRERADRRGPDARQRARGLRRRGGRHPARLGSPRGRAGPPDAGERRG